ncbi:MAG TPA: glycosyltransferase family 39 protein [Candidatus Binatia bacterium]
MPKAASRSAQHGADVFSVATGAALVAALCLVVFVWGLWGVPFYDKQEPREGLVVWEIWKTGNWILPLRAGVDIPSKPPMFHWIATLTALAAGSFNEFTVRFPSALLATLGVLLTYFAAARLWGTSAGIASAVVLATSPEWWRAATSARVDMTLTFFMLCTFLYFYFLYKAGGGIARGLLLAGFAGLATLAKGPVGAGLPGLAALLFLWRKRDFAFIKRLYLPITIPFGLVVAGTWYLLALQQGGERFFLRQIVHEIIMTPLGGAGHNHNVFYYIPALFFGMAPWSVFFPALAIFLFQQRRRLAEAELLYPLIWFASVFVLVSLALGKRTVYILPLYPAVALLFGAWWAKLSVTESSGEGHRAGWAKGGAVAAAVLVLFAAAVLAALALGWNPLSSIPGMKKDPAGLAPISAAVNSYRAAIWVYAALSVLAGLVIVRAAKKNSWLAVLGSLAIVMAAALWMIQNLFHPALAAASSFKPFMERAQRKIPDAAPVVFYNKAKKAAAFYARMYFPGFQQQARAIEPPFFLLIWEDEWEPLRSGSGLKELDRSETTGVEGRQHLVLVRVEHGAEIQLPESAEIPDEGPDE